MRLTTSNDRPADGVPFSSAGMAALIAAGLLLVFALDRATDAAPVQHLYYVPIIAAGVRFRMRGGVLAALASAIPLDQHRRHLRSGGKRRPRAGRRSGSRRDLLSGRRRGAV
jgi:hypothetical protein